MYDELQELRRRNAVVLYHLPDPDGGTAGDGPGAPAPGTAVDRLRRALDNLVDTVQAQYGVPYAGIHIITSDGQTTLATSNPQAPTHVARSDSICATVLDHDGEADLIEVPDASEEPLLAHNPFVNGARGAIRFYAAAPLIGREAVAIGTLCIASDRPRTLSGHERRSLLYLGYATMHVLDVHRRRASRPLLSVSRTDGHRRDSDPQRAEHPQIPEGSPGHRNLGNEGERM